MADLKEIDRDGMKSISQLMQQFAQLRGEELAHQEDIRKIKIQDLKDYWRLSRKEQQDFIEEKKAAEKSLTEQIMAQKWAAFKQDLKKQTEAVEAAENEADKKRRKKELEQFKKDTEAKLKQEEEIRKKYDKKRTERQLKEAKKQRNKEAEERMKEEEENMRGPFKRLRATLHAYDKDIVDENGDVVGQESGKGKGLGLLLNNALSAGFKLIGSYAKTLESNITDIANKKSEIDTRLQGWVGDTKNESYWEKMSSDIKNNIGVSPYIKQADVSNKIAEMVGSGIAFNVEQRAFLAVVKDKIATTFDATNGTLLRLIRIQQQDTTAARLGMESALTAFLNNMYETTEYMSGLATQVKDSLNEAMSLMSGENALSFEYQVQKWLGSLYSVGMSDSSVQGLSNALGQIAAGKIEGITGNGSGNLIVMAANQAGLSIGDILTNGLDESETNSLLGAAVNYLSEIYSESKDSRVVQQQLAGVFGMTAADLKAVANLSSSFGSISRNGLNYSSAMGQLTGMAGTMHKRISTAGALSNIMENFDYTLSEGIANNPILYGIYKAGNMLNGIANGIEFGLPMFMGNGMAGKFRVSDIMMTAALIPSLFTSFGAIGSGMSQIFGGKGKTLLSNMGIDTSISMVQRGTGSGLLTTNGVTTSQSGSLITNSEGSDVTNKTMSDQTDSAKSDTVAAADESEDTKLSDVNMNVMSILDVLRDIANGNKTVKVTGTVSIDNPIGAGFGD